MSKHATTVNPFTEEDIKKYTLLSVEEAERAVDRAHDCFQQWKLSKISDRQQCLENLAKLLDARKASIAQLMTDEMGKVKEQGIMEVATCAEICRYTARQSVKQIEDEKRSVDEGEALITYRPLGVILGIQPWNFPLYQVIRYSAVTIAAGNTTVLKHAANVFGMAQLIEKLFEEAGFPKYALQSLLIDGKTASQLIEHRHIQGVTFTGSDETGKKVASIAASQAKKSVLELGSNDAYLVLDDADVKLAVETCTQARVINNGQTCVSAKRFIVTERNYQTFKEGLKGAMSQLKVGDPNLKETDIGPMARKDLRDKLADQVKASIDKGAVPVLGCEIPEQPGYFYPPSILENVTAGMPAYDDELFGPVAALIKVKDDEEAIKVANDSRYGLGGGIFSQNTAKALELAKYHFDTGMVNINGYGLAHPNLPFGGVKDSGYGREHGGAGILEFVNQKSIMLA
ncbi:NAD-dependent succinate-semialdehyde dehydrogenase [Gayadomonas joobiniege]|uniref:NAD-dependent succinate-semialdehyde dehydrogenase n=1 Tax=Gayadomonas joobiniege TaxID=1234606 RepID=UPI00036F6AF8|nr:NAD-dependent succinate-semialdehyde dehydrogenase [Gayadomonas joobiniege]